MWIEFKGITSSDLEVWLAGRIKSHLHHVKDPQQMALSQDLKGNWPNQECKSSSRIGDCINVLPTDCFCITWPA